LTSLAACGTFCADLVIFELLVTVGIIDVVVATYATAVVAAAAVAYNDVTSLCNRQVTRNRPDSRGLCNGSIT